MKRIFLIAIIFILQTPIALYACDLCEENQPKILRGLTHGSGPQGTIDFIIIWSSVVIVVVCMYFFIKYLVKPGEESNDHIKYSVVQND